MARLSHEQREHARWVQQRDRDARRMNDLQDEIDRAKQVPPPSHTLTFRLRPTLAVPNRPRRPVPGPRTPRPSTVSPRWPRPIRRRQFKHINLRSTRRRAQAKGALQRRIKEEGDRYREWRERHHREVPPLVLSGHAASLTPY